MVKVNLSNFPKEFKLWKDDDDLKVLEIVTDCIKENMFLSDAFLLAGEALGRTSTNVNYRWDSHISKKYKDLIPDYSEVRKVKTRRIWTDEEDAILLKLLSENKKQYWTLVWDVAAKHLDRTPKSVKSRWDNVLSKRSNPFSLVKNEKESEKENTPDVQLESLPIEEIIQTFREIGSNFDKVRKDNAVLKKMLNEEQQESRILKNKILRLENELNRKIVAINEMMNQKQENFYKSESRKARLKGGSTYGR